MLAARRTHRQSNRASHASMSRARDCLCATRDSSTRFEPDHVKENPTTKSDDARISHHARSPRAIAARDRHARSPHAIVMRDHHTRSPRASATRDRHPRSPPAITTRDRHARSPHAITTRDHHTRSPHAIATRNHHARKTQLETAQLVRGCLSRTCARDDQTQNGYDSCSTYGCTRSTTAHDLDPPLTRHALRTAGELAGAGASRR